MIVVLHGVGARSGPCGTGNCKAIDRTSSTDRGKALVVATLDIRNGYEEGRKGTGREDGPGIAREAWLSGAIP